MSEELTKKEEKKMTTDSHSKSSEISHSRRYEKKNAKADGKRLSQEEIDKELVEIRKELDVFKMQLEEIQRLGWVLRKKPVEWHEMQRRLQQKQVKWLRESLKEVELEMEECICEPKQGEILGESEDYTKDKEWRSSEDLMDYWHSLEQFEDMLTREADEAMKPCDFNSHSLCVFAGYIEDDGQSDETVTNRNEVLEVKHYGESLLEEEGANLLQQKEFINEFLFGVRQSDEVDMDQKSNEIATVVFQEGKKMNLSDEIDERTL